MSIYKKVFAEGEEKTLAYVINQASMVSGVDGLTDEFIFELRERNFFVKKWLSPEGEEITAAQLAVKILADKVNKEGKKEPPKFERYKLCDGREFLLPIDPEGGEFTKQNVQIKNFLSSLDTMNYWGQSE